MPRVDKIIKYMIPFLAIIALTGLLFFYDIIALSTLDTNQLDIRTASTYQIEIQNVDLDPDLLTKEKPCDACKGMTMTKSQVCKGGAPYELNALNQSVQKEIYFEIMNSIIEPPKSKKKFAIPTKTTKLEIVLIELKQKLDPIFRSAIYNIAHIYGGSDVGFSIFCHIDALPSVKEIINEEWSNIRIFTISQPGKTPIYPQEYNRLVTSPEFWANFQSRFVLITQSDVAIFRKPDDWMFDYSMIGAPWPHERKKLGKPRVGNGGYTLRHVNSMKTVLITNEYAAEYPTLGYNEDLWWNSKIQNLPSEEMADEFSVEVNKGIEDFIPTGAHQLTKGRDIIGRLGKAFRLLQQYGRCI